MKRSRSRAFPAEAKGCDMALLDRHLRMTVRERVQAHRSALALVEKLRAAVRKHDERSRRTSQTAG